MDLNRVYREAKRTWYKQQNGSIVLISGGLVAGSVLPPTVSAVIGALGILYIASQQPPGGFIERMRVS